MTLGDRHLNNVIGLLSTVDSARNLGIIFDKNVICATYLF